MKFRLFAAVLLLPAIASAQKPDCKTIREIVEAGRAKELEKLEAEKSSLDKLRNDIRRGRGELDGKDGMKPRREQLQIVMDRIKANEEKIEKAKQSFPIKQFDFRELKPGEFGSFGKGDVRDFVINEIIDKTTFTAFLSYQKLVDAKTFRYAPATGTTLYLVKGIDTTDRADGKLARWDGYLYCSGTQKLKLNSGNETVFVLEPLDVESCFKKDANPAPKP